MADLTAGPPRSRLLSEPPRKREQPNLDAETLGGAFGDSAAEALKKGLGGVYIPVDVPSQSRGIVPRSAPKETGGDSATEG